MKAGVVIFGGSTPILYNSGLVELTTATCTELTDELTDQDYNNKDEGHKGYGRSGSNLQAGVEAARTLLSGDNSVDDSDKYMIILTDGGARTWYDSVSEEAVSQAYQYGSGGSTVGWNKNEDWIYRYGESWEYCETNDVSKPSFADIWAAGQTGVTIGNYALTESEYETATVGDTNVASWETALKDKEYYSTYEAACYYAAVSIVEASQKANVVMVTYPYYSNKSYTEFTEDFKTWLEDYVTRYDSSEASATEIFAAVKDQLIQLVDAGSVVVDEIGETDEYAFDFINDASRLTLTVDGTELVVDKVVNTTDTATGTTVTKYYFGSSTGSSDGTTYPFVLTYYPDGTTYEGTEYGECFVLEINVPITKDATVQLTYGVKLTNPQTTAGTYGEYDQYGESNDGSESYGLYTNNVATLYPADSNGNSLPPEDFLKPTVSYTVEETETPEESTPPEETAPPEETETPTETTTPTETETPEESTTPTETETPEESTTPTETETPEESTTPTETETPEESTAPTDPDATATTVVITPVPTTTATSPDTGDDSNALLWLVLLLLCAGGAAAVLTVRKRKDQ